jgi:hypothetical protein
MPRRNLACAGSVLAAVALLFFGSYGSGEMLCLRQEKPRSVGQASWMEFGTGGCPTTAPHSEWHATGSSPDGDIYIAGMDHLTNAALYRLNWRVGKTSICGGCSVGLRSGQELDAGRKQHRNSTPARSGIGAKSSSQPWIARCWMMDT